MQAPRAAACRHFYSNDVPFATPASFFHIVIAVITVSIILVASKCWYGYRVTGVPLFNCHIVITFF